MGKKRATAELMPVLAGLDKSATHLETAEATGRKIGPGDIATYQLQADHARHLLTSNALDPREVKTAEREHRGDGERGFAERGLDHTIRVRHFEPAPGAEDQPHSDEEIEL
ncbi:hypothetical protein [Streptomyces nanshensis]|uniref:hypothetical protein n=1 Tax=Streptomyces nanshensis TaxID=518642 RepID=UPI00099F48A2|nr:hypothetical protein [Streptomyces nanshensis]